LAARTRLLDATSFFLTISVFMTQPIIPVYLYQVLGASEQEVGVIIALMSVTAALLRAPSSIWIKNEYILRVLIFGLCLNTFSLLGYGISWDPLIFSIFRTTHGAAIALNYTLMLSLSSMIARSDQVETSITSYTMFLAMGLWTGPALGTFLRSFVGLRALMFISSLIGLISILIGVFLMKKVHGFWTKICFSKIMRRDLSASLKMPALLPTLIYLCFSFLIGAVTAYAPLRAKLGFGLEDQLIILLFTMYYFIVFSMRVILLRIEFFRKRIGAVKLLYISLFSSGFGALLIGLGPRLEFFISGLCLASFAHGFIFPLTASMAAQMTPIHLRVLSNSVYLTAFDIGNLLGSVTVAVMLGFFSLSISLAAAAIPLFLGLIAVRKLSRVYVE